VVAAAVVLDPLRPIEGLRDSKQLAPEERRRLSREIKVNALAFAIGYAGPEEIDGVNILRATLLAMERAVLGLRVQPELVRIDGNQLPAFEGHRRRYLLEAVIGGDDLVPAISAASILAKVCRDRLMCRLHRRYPLYGFDRHKGYATPQHLDALKAHGPCPIHRRSFAPCMPGSRNAAADPGLDPEEDARVGAGEDRRVDGAGADRCMSAGADSCIGAGEER
jgi:ribonuclease HII